MKVRVAKVGMIDILSVVRVGLAKTERMPIN